MNVLDEFTGIGGFALAARNVGMRHLGFVEINADCHKVLRRHFPDVRIYNDVEKIAEEFESAESIDLLCGGFPCQDLSVAGKRKGLAGERSGLWFEMLRTIERFKPRWVVIENVPGLLSGCGCTACQGVGRLLKAHARIRKSKGGAPCAVCVAGRRMLESHSGRNFTTVIQGLVELGYGCAWRVFDAQYDGVAQRRQRVFIVGHLGEVRGRALQDGRGVSGLSAEVLFESEGSAWDPAPSRQAGQRVAGAITSGAHPGGFNGQDASSGNYAFGLVGNGEHAKSPATLRATGGDAGGGSEHLITGSVVSAEVAGTLAASGAGTERPAGQENEPDFLVAGFGGNNQNGSIDIATACNAHGGTGRIDFESETFVTHSLRAEGCDASEDGTGRGTPLVVAEIAQTLPANYATNKGSTAGANGGAINLQVVAFTQNSRDEVREIGGDGSVVGALPAERGAKQQSYVCAFTERTRADGRNLETQDEVAYTLTNPGGGGRTHSRQIAGGFCVRRLTPTECERLQAFPDGWTAFDEKGNAISDSARYRMLGNAVCRTTAEWILRRIAAVGNKNAGTDAATGTPE